MNGGYPFDAIQVCACRGAGGAECVTEIGFFASRSLSFFAACSESTPAHDHLGDKQMISDTATKHSAQRLIPSKARVTV
jgi:hypothetical protein